jgi:plastocyanin
MRKLFCLAVFAVLAIAIACGSDSSSNPPPPSGPQIAVSGFSFSPADMTVDAGTTITVKNNDSAAHTVTSEASDGAFTPAGVGGVTFDTGQVTGGGSATITIPASATSGTVIPYYCANHKSMMATPNGHITVR